jgi:hypothetical protein
MSSSNNNIQLSSAQPRSTELEKVSKDRGGWRPKAAGGRQADGYKTFEALVNVFMPVAWLQSNAGNKHTWMSTKSCKSKEGFVRDPV